MDLDGRGIPGVNVVTTAFEDAAARQCEALGFDPAIVWVPHRIQNRTKAEVEALADQAVEPILKAITAAAA